MKNKTTAWTSEEDSALADAVRDKISPARMTVRLRRSEASIKRRMRELGLTGKRRIETVAAAEPRTEIGDTVRRFLQACKAGDLINLIDLYDTDATLECACTGDAVYAGLGAIQEYWAPKIGSRHPKAFTLVSSRGDNGRVVLDYLSYEGKPVRMNVSVDEAGKILRSECAPRNCTSLAA